MKCKKCGGRMYVDRMYAENRRIDIFCLLCGKRVYVNQDDNAFGRWLHKNETALRNALA